jgi:hypothetical protein
MIIGIILGAFIWLNNSNTSSPLDQYKWLLGTWIVQSPNGVQRVETWSETNETLFTGRGIRVSAEKDSTLLETLELKYAGGTYWYIPTVRDQNNAMPVPFSLTFAKGHQFIFENPEHDFPQRIIYHFRPIQPSAVFLPTKGDTLYVRVETLNGSGIDFTFLRN